MCDDWNSKGWHLAAEIVQFALLRSYRSRYLGLHSLLLDLHSLQLGKDLGEYGVRDRHDGGGSGSSSRTISFL